jgi:hypothetical protein
MILSNKRNALLPAPPCNSRIHRMHRATAMKVHKVNATCSQRPHNACTELSSESSVYPYELWRLNAAMKNYFDITQMAGTLLRRGEQVNGWLVP